MLQKDLDTAHYTDQLVDRGPAGRPLLYCGAFAVVLKPSDRAGLALEVIPLDAAPSPFAGLADVQGLVPIATSNGDAKSTRTAQRGVGAVGADEFARESSVIQFRSRQSAHIQPDVLKSEVSPSCLGLTGRQVEVLSCIMQGKSNKGICRMLDLAEPTVKNHITGILRALRVTNRTEAVIAVNKLGWDLPVGGSN